MCAMHMLCKTGTVFLRVADPNFMFDCIGVRTIRTHVCRLLPSYLALALNQLLILSPILIIPSLFSAGYM